MRLTDVLTKPPAHTRVMVKQFRFIPLGMRQSDVGPDVWLESGNLIDWLGDDAVLRAECVATHELGPAELHANNNGNILFEAYLDGELIGEIRDDTNGRILRPCVILDGLTEVAELVINLKTSCLAVPLALIA